MAKILNFDAVTVDTVDITKGGTTYSLRDDVSAETVLPMFKLTEIRAKYGDKPSYDQMMQFMDEQKTLLLEVCTAIFQFTPAYAAMTQDEVAALLTPEQRQQVCQAFFTLRFAPSSEPQNATETPAPVAAPTETETAGDESAPTIASPSSSLPASDPLTDPAA